jgi:hypothetical protein
MLDKSKYPNKQSIGDAIRKSARKYFSMSKKGKPIEDKEVKKVFIRKEIISKKGGK